MTEAQRHEKIILILSVFVAGLCSIIYELLISTASSYFLGDSVKHFSITIGTYMASMGAGSFLSRSMHRGLFSRFIFVELLLGLAGGLCVPYLYFAFAYLPWYSFHMILSIVVIGVLTGFEVPLLTRIMERYYTLKVNLSNVLTLDYLGALVATLLFPFLLLPFLGTFQTSLAFGIANVLLGGVNLWVFRHSISLRARRWLGWSTGIALLLLTGGLITSGQWLEGWSSAMYEDRVVYTERSSYQKLVLTRNKDDVRLYLNGNLQFSSLDEHRYHEALVHIPMSQLDQVRDVLVLGGGDGLAARQLLKYSDPPSITIVDLDPAVFNLARKNPYLRELNKGSLESRHVKTVAGDAFQYLKDTDRSFDLIIADLPDPNNAGLARLYSKTFYLMAYNRLRENGVFVTQATSPYHATKAFWCIVRTLQNTPMEATLPYHYPIPSFGEWGFAMARKNGLLSKRVDIPVPTRSLTPEIAHKTFLFEKDLLPPSRVTINTLDQPKVLEYYLEGWQYYY